MNAIIPAPDQLAIPGPFWLFQVLLVFTFLLHVLTMNALLGGSIIAVVSYFRGKVDKNHQKLAKTIYSYLPTVIATAVSFGVAPLLFVQLIYGQFFYTSSIILGGIWLSVVLFIIFAYYSSYFMKFNHEKKINIAKYVSFSAPILFLIVASIFANNLSILEKPLKWYDLYFKSIESGENPMFHDTIIYLRLTHVLLGAIALTGIWIFLIGYFNRNKDENWSVWAKSYGLKIFLFSTLLNIVAGTLYLMAQPREIMLLFMGKNITLSILFILSLIITGFLLYITYRRKNEKFQKKEMIIITSVFSLLLLFMLIIRHQVRAAYLKDYFKLEALKFESQDGMMALFFIFFLIGTAVVAYIIKTAVFYKQKTENKKKN
ncbi:MAG: hypothetical protein OEZ22_07080 [Spirochaetia bacterium]|nr:hypothetical protein [Spirochaetia bacterium]